MNLEKRYQDRLADLHGRLPDGTPKLRIVTPAEARRPHGRLKGQPKYFDPVSNTQMPFLVLEQWLSPEFAAPKEIWNYELLGVHPSECSNDCCKGGVWGMYTPLTNEFGEYVPFSDKMMEAIERRVKIDREFAKLSAQARLDAIEADRAAADNIKAEEAWEQLNADRDHYLTHKKEMDNADNRVYIGVGKATMPETKGIKEAIGSPLEKV